MTAVPAFTCRHCGGAERTPVLNSRAAARYCSEACFDDAFWDPSYVGVRP